MIILMRVPEKFCRPEKLVCVGLEVSSPVRQDECCVAPSSSSRHLWLQDRFRIIKRDAFLLLFISDPRSPYTISQHLHLRQVWRTGSSAMCVWALTQAVVYMTLTIGRERLTP